ncbi:MAG: carbamoyltransferase HypF [Chitinophagales bacterium]
MTFHLHIKGRVQGVGFRPHIYKCASEKNIAGYASNEADGVHVHFNAASTEEADSFTQRIIQQAPSRAIIRAWSLNEKVSQSFSDFSIRVQENNAAPDLLLAPDFSMCSQCRNEFYDPFNRRYQYPFITCTLCGPRYSIMQQLPYERHLTTMHGFTQCTECVAEYSNINDRRYFSQTNSCTTCGIRLSWHSKNRSEVSHEPKEILPALIKAIQEGKIIAVKGIGGFLLMCDASDKNVIQKLRQRKHRPVKPFALLFPTIEMVREYTYASPAAIHGLLSEVSPIVLLPSKEICYSLLDMMGIAPGLSTVGVMLPYAPLLEWIAVAWKNPLVATSGNLSGSSIVFESGKKEELFAFADFILDHNRDIVIPKDDSVVRFSHQSQQPIFIRRSRGLAPAIIVETELKDTTTIFAAGAMLKSAFAIQHHHQVYLSQFLGNLESFDAQQNYLHTLKYFMKLLQAQPQTILADLHPDYPSTQIARDLSEKSKVPLKQIQHHEAHFAAILGEHDLFKSEEKILGVIWDGTGLGNDGNIWGGEFFMYENGTMNRVYHLESFTNLAGDKMAREPRLSALAISHQIQEAGSILASKFSEQELNFYEKSITHPRLQNTSAGRYFDAVASLLNLLDTNAYEGEAALQLEQCAYNYLKEKNFTISGHYFNDEIDQLLIPMQGVIRMIIRDINSGKDTSEIAALFHSSLAAIICKVVLKEGVKNIAFSGGVFQNSVLIDMVHLQVAKNCKIYFHQQMPSNDECIAFGQLMHFTNIKN